MQEKVVGEGESSDTFAALYGDHFKHGIWRLA